MKPLIVCIILLALPLAHAVSNPPANEPADLARPISVLKARLQPAVPYAVATVCVGPDASLCRTQPAARP